MSHMQAWDREANFLAKSAASCSDSESRIVVHVQALFGGDYQACRTSLILVAWPLEFGALKFTSWLISGSSIRLALISVNLNRI